MTVSYFRYKRLADRQASFQQYTDMEVAEREVAYRREYVQRLRSDLARRQTRPRRLSRQIKKHRLQVSPWRCR